ncbi:MAG TPA: lipoprotein-releasing ABC transporter permease subunit [Spongiibacteraceae bacterium]|nr:lipoprotein-releasing ABC transporter permease subunit [Spongiibacteraceae bacterium]
MRSPSTFIGVRYGLAAGNSQLVSFLSRVSMAGLILAVGLLITVLAVMNGFDREMRERILGVMPQLTLRSANPADLEIARARLAAMPEVVAMAPFRQLGGLLVAAGEAETVVLYALDPAQEDRVSVVANFLRDGSTLAVLSTPDQIIIGQGLATRLALDSGDTLSLLVPSQTGNPRLARFALAGVVNTGTELDNSLVLMSLAASERLVPLDAAGLQWRARLQDLFDAPRLARELNRSLPWGVAVNDWTASYGNLYTAIKMSRQLVVMMLVAIIAVAAFNVVSSLVMVVNDKRGDIAILRTQGCTPGGILRIFMVQGCVIGAIGVGLGVVLGLALAWNVTALAAGLERLFDIRLLQSDVYPVNYLPSDPRWEDVLLVAGTAFAVSFLATLYPAWRAAQLAPAQALRHD